MATSFLTVATPGRTAPRGGLLAAANVIDSSDPHILQGVTYVPDGCDIPLLTPGSCWVTEVPVETEKTFEGIGDPVSSTVTFVLHAGVECFIGPDSDFDQRAKRVLDFGESVAVEKIVLSQLLSPASSLGTETSLVNGVGRAEQWLSANYPALGLIHMDRRVTSLGMQNGTLRSSEGYRVETPQGVPVANGGGYGLATGAGSDPFNIYATGQVNVWRSATTQTDAIEWTKNTSLALVERHYAVTIDCDLIAKIVVDVP